MPTPASNPHARPPRPRAFSLVEVTVSILLVAVMLTAAASAVGAAARARLIESDIARGSRLARALLAEVLVARYADPLTPTNFGVESGESQADRSTLNDVDDFHALAESPPVSRDRQPLPDATGWTRTVKVEEVPSGGLLGLLGSNTGLRRITVKVVSPRGKPTTLIALVSRDGSAYPATLPPTGVVALTNVRIAVDNGPAVSVSADMLNTPDAP